MKPTNQLGNPAAVALAMNPETIKAGRIILGLAAAGVLLWFGRKKWLEWRRQSFLEENINNPDVQIAMIFRRAMFRVEFSSFPFNMINIPDGTDEATLNSYATRVSSIQNVQQAYKILFSGNLIMDVYSELNNKELRTFFDFLNSRSNYDSQFEDGIIVLPITPFKVGQTLEVSNPDGMTLFKAEKVNGKYQNSGVSLGYKKIKEVLGEIVEIHKSKTSEQYFYVIDRPWVVDTLFGYGWVKHTDTKVKS